MKASKLDLMKLAMSFDGEFSIEDFSPEELDEMLGYIEDADSIEEMRRRYFEYYDDIKDRTLHRHKWSD
jgi:hypothetical protein